MLHFNFKTDKSQKAQKLHLCYKLIYIYDNMLREHLLNLVFGHIEGHKKL